MNILRTRRPFALLASMVAIAGALAFLFGSGPTAPHGAQAAGALQKSVSCADVWQDIGNDTPLGSPHDGNDKLAANSISRLDVPSQNTPTDGGPAFNADLTSVTYLGPDFVPGDTVADPAAGAIPGDSIPDTMPAAVGCAAATADASPPGTSLAEQNTFRPHTVIAGKMLSDATDFANQYGPRSGGARYGTYDGTNGEDGGAANTCTDGIDNGDSGTSGYTLNAVSFDRLDTDCYDYPGGGANTLVISGCAWSEALNAWGRTDVFTVISTKTSKTTNYGKSILTLATAAPIGRTDRDGDTFAETANNPSQCTGGLAFPGVVESTARDVRTDEAIAGKNTGLTADTDGAGIRDTADGVADDWDGDGCTDWDELDKNFNGQIPATITGDVRGLDPFNPNDCDQNYDSTLSIVTTVLHNTNTAGSFLGTGNGQYFRCLADSTDPKGGGTRTLTLRLGCYSDSTVTVVNTSYPDVPYVPGNIEDPGPNQGPCNDNIDNDNDGKKDAGDSDCHASTCAPAPQTMCGDGRSGSPPPSATCQPTPGNCTGAFVAISTSDYPVITSSTCASTPPSNCFNKGTNSLTIGGCFPGLGGATFGPNVYGSGVFDTRVGVGTFTIRIQITSQAECLSGGPFTSGTDINGTATIVELGSKKTPAGASIPIGLRKNSDRDGCTDEQELRSTQAMGGQRDPYNDYDYDNPTADKQNRVDDILAVVNQYFIDDPSGQIDYGSLTDRTAIPGGNPWNLGPPNGQQRVDDILAAVKQYFHDCNA